MLMFFLFFLFLYKFQATTQLPAILNEFHSSNDLPHEKNVSVPVFVWCVWSCLSLCSCQRLLGHMHHQHLLHSISTIFSSVHHHNWLYVMVLWVTMLTDDLRHTVLIDVQFKCFNVKHLLSIVCYNFIDTVRSPLPLHWLCRSRVDFSPRLCCVISGQHATPTWPVCIVCNWTWIGHLLKLFKLGLKLWPQAYLQIWVEILHFYKAYHVSTLTYLTANISLALMCVCALMRQIQVSVV